MWELTCLLSSRRTKGKSGVIQGIFVAWSSRTRDDGMTFDYVQYITKLGSISWFQLTKSSLVISILFLELPHRSDRVKSVRVYLEPWNPST